MLPNKNNFCGGNFSEKSCDMKAIPAGIISMQIVPGASTESICALVVSIATKLECCVSFELNNIELIAKSSQSFTALTMEYYDKVKELNNWIDYTLKQKSTK